MHGSPSRFPLRRLTFGFALLMLLGTSAPAHAQDMEVPTDIQLALFLKVIAFDRQRDQHPDVELVVGIVYQGHYQASNTAHEEAMRELRRASTSGRRIRTVAVDLDHDELLESLQREHVTLLYVAPLRAVDISTLATAATSAHVTTVTGVPAYVAQGIAVSVRLLGDRPKLLISLSAARKSGADFTAELLKLAQVLP